MLMESGHFFFFNPIVYLAFDFRKQKMTDLCTVSLKICELIFMILRA